MENESRKSHNKTLQKVLLAVLSIILMTGIAFFMANVVHNNSSQPTSSKVENGLSAYELAVEQGYKGNLNDWLKSLDGKSAFEIAKENGYSGTEKEWNKAVANVSNQNKAVITNAGFNKNGDFILTLLDGTDVNVSNVSNSKGKDGTDGKNGTNGKNGANGKDGRSITLASVNSEGQLVITYSDGSSVNLDKLVGINGVDGVSISNSSINDKGELIITYSNRQICNLGKVVGVDGKNGINGINGSDGNNGKNGQDGISVVKSEINSNGELVVTYSNSVIDNLGKVVGSDGAKGEKGDKGDAGEQGIQGIAGKDGKDGINGTNGVDGKDGTDGKDGVGINTVNITEDGKLNITLTNGTTLNLGTIKGEKGDKGDTGVQGEKGDKGDTGAKGEKGDKGDTGEQGIQGVAGKDGKDGKDGINGTDGVDGKDGINGTNGVDGKDGTNGKDGVGIANVLINTSGELELTFSDGQQINLGNVKGSKGDKGEKGDTGEQGVQGIAGKDGINGTNGVDGKDGTNGKDGTDGQDGVGIANVTVSNEGALSVTLTNGTVLDLGNIKGANGIGISKSEVNASGELVLTYTDGTVKNLGNVVGSNGADGQDGVGIKTVTLSSTGELMVTLSDNSVINLGNVKGEKGDKGDKGDAGVQGEKGEKGDKGDTGRGIAKTELVNGELIITYTDGTKENLGSVTSDENTADKYLVYKILTDDSVSVSLKSEYIGDLEGKITIPSEHNGRKVTEIKGFTGCQLSEIELPDTLEIIGPDTFSGCTNLKSITIPKNVYRIQGNAFLNSGLQTAKFENPSNWKKYQVYTYNGYDSTLTSVSSSSLSDETKAAELLTETYNYKNDSSISWKSGTYYFFKD